MIHKNSLIRFLFISTFSLLSTIGTFPPPAIAQEQVTVILIDRSDKLRSAQTQKAMEEITLSLLRNDDIVRVGERVLVYAVDYNSITNLLPPEFSKTKPQQKPKLGILLGDPVLVEARFRRDFLEPIMRSLSRNIGTSKFTPLTQVVIDVFSLPTLQEARSVQLIIFSDMFENTKEFSLYHNYTDKEAMFQKYLVSRQGKAGVPNFRNTNVRIYCMPRDVNDEKRLKQREIFWKWFFGQARIQWQYLPGI